MAEAINEPTTNIKKNRDGPELLSLDPSLLLTLESTTSEIRSIRKTQENHESVVFIWFNPVEQFATNFLGPLRAINDIVHAFDEQSACFKAIKSSREKIFFITSSTSSELINKVHNFPAVEAIFIIDPIIETIKGEFPKLAGFFNQQEELFRVLKEVLELFEQIQLELFAFEQEEVFLWSQLYREELSNRKKSSKKQIFIDGTRQYYRDNAIISRLIDEIDKTYRPAESVTWCLRSPFPSRFVHHALRSHNAEQLRVCRPLFIDANRVFQQQPKRKTSEQFYRGMKLSNELLDKFQAYIGQLVCTNGFFPCTKSRANALALASLPSYRPDLAPVFFKIDCDASSLYTDLPTKQPGSMIVFDICTAFRIVYVKRDPMTVIKMKTAGEFGKKIALHYLEQHSNESIQSLMEELVKSLKPPTPPPPTPPPPKVATPPPPPPPPSPPKVVTSPPLPRIKKSALPSNDKRDPILTAEEMKAQRYAERGEIDRALASYQNIQPSNARILNAIGQLSAEKKGDFKYAIQCHTKALKMQEQANEDTADTLTDLGNAHHHCDNFDLALGSHTRALALRQTHQTPDNAAIASNLVGIANAHWARREYPEAIDYAQRALQLRENLIPSNDASVAATLGMLGNIYQDCGNIALALELCKRSFRMFERTLSPDSPILAELLCNLGTMQLSMEFLGDACRSFERAVVIYKKCLPQGHSDLVAAEKDHQEALRLYQKKKKESQKRS